MSLRWKILLFVLGVSVAFAGTSYLVQRWIMLPGFEQVEGSAAREDVTRCVQALERDAEFLASSANDYGAWDDTYQFIEDVNEEYQAGNLIPETFRNLKLNLLMFVRTDGTVVWGELRSDDAEELIDAPELLAAIARPEHPLVARTDPDSKLYGVLTTSLGPMLIGSAAITTSDRSGAVRGAVLMARFVTEEAVAELAARTRVAVQLHRLDAVPAEESSALAHLTDTETIWTNAEARDTLRSYTYVRDIFAEPALLLCAELPRSITQRGRSAAGLAGATSVGGGFLLTLVMWIVLSRLIVGPLSRVTAHAVRVGSSSDLRARLRMTRPDEIGVLAREFDRMVDRLAESQAQMLEVAHHAGKAEVATNVLHNVGNVLNSVNVSANVVNEKLRGSEVGTLKLAAKMLVEHQDRLGEFVTRDERGRQLPAFLGELATQLSAEQQTMVQEMHGLCDSIEHIRRIVDMQQEHSRHQALREPVEPATLVEEALALSADAQAGIVRIERDLEAFEALPLDRHRLLQILVNVLTNARQALIGGSVTDPCLRVSLGRGVEAGRECLRIQVVDNGKGIAPENLERIFAFGFSTRANGHGFGLHGAANMAREMGGTLVAESAGPGRGAAFTLTVPVAPAEVRS